MGGGQVVDIKACTQQSDQVPLTATLIGYSLLPSSPSSCMEKVNAGVSFHSEFFYYSCLGVHFYTYLLISFILNTYSGPTVYQTLLKALEKEL